MNGELTWLYKGNSVKSLMELLGVMDVGSSREFKDNSSEFGLWDSSGELIHKIQSGKRNHHNK